MSCRLSAVVAVLAVAGCQGKPPQLKPQRELSPAAAVANTTTAPAHEYEAVVASALVFDPPVIMEQPPLELSRADREPRASVGYEGPTIETYYVRVDDSQVNFGLNGRGGSSSGRFGWSGNADVYERRAVSERIGVRYR
jgi:hypothetical protein